MKPAQLILLVTIMAACGNGRPALCKEIRWPAQKGNKAPTQRVAIVAKVKGVVLRNGTPWNAHVGDAVCAEWTLACKTGELTIRYDGNKTDTIKAGGKLYTVPHTPAQTTGPIHTYFSIFGRTQSPSLALFSPPHIDDNADHPENLGKVWPDRFVVRWVPSQDKASIGLILREYTPAIEVVDKRLWEKANLDGTSGEYCSEELRDVLRQFRKVEPNGLLQLSLVQAGHHSQDIVFAVLPLTQEEELPKELAVWDKEPGIMRYLGEADVYSQHHLYTEVATVYEEALKFYCGSVDLRFAAIFANRKIGNMARADEHIKMLPDGMTIPGD